MTPQDQHPGRLRRISVPTAIVLVLLGTAAFMGAFELSKTILFPHITLWQSHAITIALASLCAAGLAYLVLTRIEGVVAERGRDEIREAEERFRRLSDAAFEGIGIVDQGRILDTNARLAEMLGYEPDELIGMPVLELVAPEHRERVQAHIRSSSGDLYEHLSRRKDGSTFMVEVQGRPFVYRGKTVRVSAVRDITQRKAAEAALRHSEAQYQALVDGVRDTIFAVAVDGILTALNPAFEEATGWSREEWLGRRMTDLLHPADVGRAVEALAAALSGERRSTMQLRVRAKPGGYRIGEFRSSPQHVDGRVIGLIGIVRDITERVELEEQLRHAQKMEAVGRLAGGVAHDFNNLLLVIGMYCQLLLDELRPGDPRRKEVEEIARAGERAGALTRQLLAFSRRQVLEPKVLDINAVIAGTEKMLGRLLGEKVTFVARLDPAVGAVKADVGQLEQVLMNLAVNAKDAMPEGGTLTVTTANAEIPTGRPVEEGELPPGRYVTITVTDTGMGMDPEIRSHIFEPFFTTKPKGQGTGLGLSTVYGIVRQSEGHVAVESEVGRGSTFRIFLPRVADRAAGAGVAPDAATGPATPATVLVVEDEAAVLDVVCEALRRDGYRVLQARSADAALRLAEEAGKSLDLLVTDVVLPGMDGRTLADRLTTAHPKLDVLFVSGYADDGILPHGALAPGLKFLQKPFTANTLRHKVREILAPRAAR